MSKITNLNAIFLITYIGIFSEFFIKLLNFNLSSYLIGIILFYLFLINIKIKFSINTVVYCLFLILFSIIYFLVKGDINFIGYIKYIYLGIIYYELLKNDHTHFDLIISKITNLYSFILFTVLFEVLFILIGIEPLGLYRYLSISTSEELLSRSRWLEKLFDIYRLAPASISIYPQGSTHLILFCLIIFGPMPIRNPLFSLPKYLISILLLFYSSNLTIFFIYIIYAIFLFYITRKYFIVILVILLSLIVFEISHLSNADTYSIYKDLWIKNYHDLFNFDEFLYFGFNSKVNINDIIDTFELGIIQILFFSGMWPVLFNFYFYRKYIYFNIFRKNKLIVIDWFQYSGFILITASILSMSHYLSFFYSSIQFLLALQLSMLMRTSNKFNVSLNQS